MFNASDEEEEKAFEIPSTEGISQKDEDGNNMVNDYTFIRTIGRGSSAKVKLCKVGEDFFAAKVFRKSLLHKKKTFIPCADGEMRVSSGITDLHREIAIMKKLTHKNVVKLKEVVYDEGTDKLFLIMDYCEKGPVMDFDDDLNKFCFPWTNEVLSENVVRKIFRDAVCGLEYLHYQNIAHRDIKPQNMLITEDFEIKLADFGQSHLFNDPNMTNRALGTYFFYPPECCGESEEFLSKPTDIWALGITFYTILYQKLPFDTDSCMEIFELIQTFELEFPEDIEVDPELKSLITRMLDKNPETRISVFEILLNPWINKGCNPLVYTQEKIEMPTEGEISAAIKSMKNAILAVSFI